MKIDRATRVMLDPVVAFVLLTRLPMPRLPKAAFERGGLAVWAYPVVGLVIGGIGCMSGLAAFAAGLPATLSAAVSLATMILATGAMHEDGLADVADGFWGGYDPERRLAIMKDSQIGTYGTLALIVIIVARWSAFAALLPTLPTAIIASAMLSRAAMPILMTALPPARASGLSQSVGCPGRRPVLIGLCLAAAGSAVMTGNATVFAILLMLVTTVFAGLLCQRKIGGQTGDVLGFTQQVTELVVLAFFVSLMT